jgi:hypothetical protein
MKQTYYWIGLAVVIVIVVLVSVSAHKQADAPVTTTTTATTTTTTTPVVKGGSPAPTTSAAQYITVHVKKGGLSTWYSSPTTTVASEIHIDNPPLNTTATSPMSVSGAAKGTWFFEASMPIFLTDAKGKVLASSHVTAQSDWMTEGMVPFLGKLTFARQPTGSTGVFVIENDNPSGIAANSKRVEILVTFN